MFCLWGKGAAHPRTCPHLAKPAGEPELLQGQVIWKHLVVEEDLYLDGRRAQHAH